MKNIFRTIVITICILLALPVVGKTATNDVRQVMKLVRQADSLVNLRPKQAMLMSRKSIEIADRSGIDSLKAHALYAYGLSLFYISRYENCIDTLKQADTLFTECGMDYPKYENNRIMGECQYQLGNIMEANTLLIESLEYFEKIPEAERDSIAWINIGYNLNDIALIGSELDSLYIPMRYFQRSLKIMKSVNDACGIATALTGIGNWHCMQEDYENGMANLSQAYEIIKSTDNKYLQAGIISNMGYLYDDLQQYDSALALFNEAIAISKEIEDMNGLGYIHRSIGIIYLNQKKMDLALKHMELALNYTRKTEVKRAIVFTLYGLVDIYQATGKYKQALEAFSEATQIRDYVYREENRKMIIELERKYDSEKKAKENELLRKDQELKSNVIIFLVIVALMIIVLILILYSKFKSNRRHNDRLREYNRQVTAQKEELGEMFLDLQRTQQQLIESEKMASLGNLVAGVAHEINTPVGIGITAASLMKDKADKFEEKYKSQQLKRKDMDDFLNEMMQSSELILNNLKRTGSLIQSFKQVSVDQSSEQVRNFEVKAYIEDIIRSLHPKIKNSNVNIKVDSTGNYVVNSYPGPFAQIITNFIMNTITHGLKENSPCNINIHIDKFQEGIRIKYDDNGKGINPEIKDKIFDPFVTTNKQTGTGLGLNIVYNLVTQKLHGNISVRSFPGEGVEFEIRLPRIEIVKN